MLKKNLSFIFPFFSLFPLTKPMEQYQVVMLNI